MVDSAPAGRDRDVDGRARNSRPRDALGRPLPRGAAGTPRLTEGVVRTPEQTITLARQLLDEGRPFHAHEVFEDAWKSGPTEERSLWKGYAQLAVGLTHLARGNPVGATSLLRRGSQTLSDVTGTPHGLPVRQARQWAEELAARLARDGQVPSAPPPLPLRADG